MPPTKDAQKTVTAITGFLQENLPVDRSLGARLKFDYEGGGIVFIDGRKLPPLVHNRDEAADCTVIIDADLHLKLLHREADQGQAFRQGHMRISGDVAVAVRLGPLFFASELYGSGVQGVR